MLHLFPCTGCEKSFEITEKNAGMAYACPFCEAENTIPGMRDIRKLPIKHESSTNKAPKLTSRNEAGSWLFSGGLLVAVIGGLLGIALLGYANSIRVDTRVEEQIEWRQTQIGELAGGQLWEVWDQMAEGLPDWAETEGVRYNKQSGHLKNIAYGLFGISAIGALALIGSFFGRKS